MLSNLYSYIIIIFQPFIDDLLLIIQLKLKVHHNIYYISCLFYHLSFIIENLQAFGLSFIIMKVYLILIYNNL